MVSHSLASSEYNVRRQQCEEGVTILKKTSPAFNSLRDVSIGELEKYKRALNPVVYKRCHYVISENDRVLKSCELLREGDIEAFGKLMYESHDGLSKEYEVSCEELDFLAETARKMDGVVGGRMMGGGFGGCTINIVKAAAVEKFEKEIKESYNEQFGKTPEVYITQIEEGARRIATNL
jgi:galactokinase